MRVLRWCTMIELLILRHGPTEWNKDKRLQGRLDIALSAEGRKEVGFWRIPTPFADFNWVSSPLSRAQDTASILGHTPTIEPALVEMSWGDWEGLVWRELLDANDPELDINRAKGLDFRPLNGESPRDVQKRLSQWLMTIEQSTTAVCHKGVLQALYALATGWQMTDTPSEKIRDGCAHLFNIDQGRPVVSQMNIPLKEAS